MATKKRKITVTKHKPKRPKRRSKQSLLAQALAGNRNPAYLEAFQKMSKGWRVVVKNDDPMLTVKVDPKETYYVGYTRHFQIQRCTRKDYRGFVQKYVDLRSLNGDFNEKLYELSENDDFFNRNPTIPVRTLFTMLPLLQTSTDPGVMALVAFLNVEFADVMHKYHAMEKAGLIGFDMLWMVFRRNQEVVAMELDHEVAGQVVSTEYRRWFDRITFRVTLKVMKYHEGKFGLHNDEFEISEFDKPMAISALPIKPLDDATKLRLGERGKKFTLLTRKPAHVQYTGSMAWRTWFGYQYYRADGRVMIDPKNFSRVNDNYSRLYDKAEQEWDEIPQEMAHMCPSRAMGFGFTTKRWGEFFIDNISEITFRSESFESLVLPADTKHMVTALVANGTSTFSDVIDGKGGGCIFLLHGEPGTGKTLTAESVAELMHRPLYSVSVGELGTNPAELEENLREILDMATIWNALILIDEADIFLEARSEDNDIDRNAMIGIFLRLLEYHQGVMFLTTNRVLSFDAAFHSRISLAIQYRRLDANSRSQVWTNLLKAAKIENIDVAQLAKHEINGRQIKTAIRLAQALAKADGIKTVTIEHLLRPILHQEAFLRQIAEGDVTQLHLDRKAGTGTNGPHEPSAAERVTAACPPMHNN